MAINSVDMSKALKNEAYAAQVIRSGKCSSSERSQIAAQWGSDKITKWESVDSTQYEIADDEKSTARAKGEKKVDEATGGFDGKSDGGKSAASVGMAVVGTAAGVAATSTSLAGTINGLLGTNYSAAKGSGFVAALFGGILLAMSTAIKAMNPNKDQAQACDDLAPVMQDSQNELEEQQGILSDTTEEITEKTDDLIKAGNEANKATETKQKEYERMQARYQELVAKQEAAKSGGEPLTDAEKAEFSQLSGILGTLFEDLKNIKVEGDENVEDAKEEVAESQEVYDDAALKMEEVQEITEFSAEFDEATVDNAQLVKYAAMAGEVGAAGVIIGGSKAVALGWPNFAEIAAGAVAIAEGGVAAYTFSNIIKDQNDYKSRAEAGVENRVATQDVNTATNDVYEEELDNYAGDIDLIDEIELTETSATETPIVALSETQPAGNDSEKTANSPLGVPTSNDAPEVNPFAPPSSNNNDDGKTGNVNGADDNNSNPFGNPDDKKEEV